MYACPRKNSNTLNTLENIYVSSLTGAQIPLSQLARIEFEDSPTLIQHYNNERSMTITSSVKTGYNTDRVTKQILAKVRKLRLPEGFKIIPAGEIESRQESFGGIGTAIIIAIFGIFAVLILEFRTFKSTLIVLSVIPLGIIGGLLALFLTGYTLSFAAAIGFVALIGIEIKNSILLVDFTNQMRQQGTPLDEAIIRAGEIRFLPVLLTTLTAIGGLLPIALGNSNLYSPLAWVIIGGLITSTLLARLVTPVMYKLLPPGNKVKIKKLNSLFSSSLYNNYFLTWREYYLISNQIIQKMRILITGFVFFVIWCFVSAWLYNDKLLPAIKKPVAVQTIPETPTHEADSLMKLKASMPENLLIYFEFNEAKFKPDPQTDNSIPEFKAWLDKYPQSMLSVTGHTDLVGTPDYNYKLALKRAQVVGNYLENQGVSASRMITGFKRLN